MITAHSHHLEASRSQRDSSAVANEYVSVVIPTYKSCASLADLTRSLEAVLSSTGQEFEIIVVDDGSPDQTWETLQALKATHSRLKIARLLRNTGQHNAILCGFSLARGSIIVTMDDDLQNPPEELPKLIAAVQAGYDLAIGAYERKEHRAARNLAGMLIDAMQRRIFSLPAGFQLTSFRAIRRIVVTKVLSMGGAFPYITAMLLSNTSRVVNVRVRHEPRRYGRSNYDFTRSIFLAFNLLFNYSHYPLYLITALCVIALSFSVGVGLWVLRNTIIGSTLPGWASTIMIISIFNGAILLALVVHTLYLSRITQQLTRSEAAFTIGEFHE